MDDTHALPDGFTIRPPATDAELEDFFQVVAMQFASDIPIAVAGADFLRYVEQAPDWDRARIRGAYRGDTNLGGYLIDERDLRIGPARLPTGCIGGVVTRPDFRGQGVATALMNDAFAFARARGHVLLLLHGLANFYDRFGYVDVFDATEHRLDREEILTHSPSPYRVRPATGADAEAMLRLYDRHFGTHPGSSARSIEHQRFLIEFDALLDRRFYQDRNGTPHPAPIVAVDEDGLIRGYFAAAWGPFRWFGSEVAADNWPATLALIQFEAHRLNGQTQLHWPLPPLGLAATMLADHFTVRAETTHRPRENWMAALVDPAGLLASFQPVWESRLRSSLQGDTSGLELRIDETASVRLGAASHAGATELPRLRLPPRVLLPLTFGFRSPAWAMAQSDVSVADELGGVLEGLFPPVRPWIPAVNGF
jgi:GNAT superfamily N-acetyltransferase